MKEEWLLHGAAVPVTCETVIALIAEIKRLIDVVGGMALAQPEQEPVCPDCKAKVLYECVACSSNNYPPQRTWVGLTDEEIDQGLLRSNHALQTAGAWRDGVEWATKQLKCTVIDDAHPNGIPLEQWAKPPQRTEPLKACVYCGQLVVKEKNT